MSFTNALPKIFSGESIERNAPTASGVYGLSNASNWLFIGESDNIKASMLGHLNRSGPIKLNAEPTGFSFELSDQHSRLARQQYLIVELSPSCQNGRVSQKRKSYR